MQHGADPAQRLQGGPQPWVWALGLCEPAPLAERFWGRRDAWFPLFTPASASAPRRVSVATALQCSGRSVHDALSLLSQDGCGDGVPCGSIQPVGCLLL